MKRDPHEPGRYLLATKLFPDAKSALAYVRRRRALTWMCWNPDFIKRLDEWAAHSGIVRGEPARSIRAGVVVDNGY